MHTVIIINLFRAPQFIIILHPICIQSLLLIDFRAPRGGSWIRTSEAFTILQNYKTVQRL